MATPALIYKKNIFHYYPANDRGRIVTAEEAKYIAQTVNGLVFNQGAIELGLHKAGLTLHVDRFNVGDKVRAQYATDSTVYKGEIFDKTSTGVILRTGKTKRSDVSLSYGDVFVVLELVTDDE